MPPTIGLRLLLLVLVASAPALISAVWLVASIWGAERDAQEHLLRGAAWALTASRPLPGQRIAEAQTQHWPPGWVGVVMDERGAVVARHPPGIDEAPLASAARALASTSASVPEGRFDVARPGGQRLTGVAVRSPQGGTRIVAMPSAAFNRPAQRAALQATGIVLAMAALAAAGAAAVWGGIVAPLRRLQAAAVRLQTGAPVPEGATGLAEFDEVTGALAQAAQAGARAHTELEHRLSDARQQVQQAGQRLQQNWRVELLGRLTGGVAHEMNNLLGVVSNSAHLIGRHARAADLDVPLRATHRALQTGSDLTRQLLRLAGRRPAGPAALDLGRGLPEMLEGLRSALGRHIAMSVTVAPGTPPVWVDAAELELALLNLALNARDAMPQGGGLQVSARLATPQDQQDFAEATDRAGAVALRQVLIAVHDDGVGVAPQAAARGFDPFVKPELNPRHAGAGAGPDLGRVQSFTAHSGGAVRLASTPGLGSSVLMLLPAATVASPHAHASVAAAGGPVAGARVLLVDDNEDLAMVTEALLHAHGAQVQRTRDGAQALAVLAAQPAFDVVLSDMAMPGAMEGLTLAHLLRHLYPRLAVVLTSGGPGAAAAVDGFPFLRKPCAPDELLAVLDAAITAPQLRGAAPLPASPSAAYSFKRL